MEHFIFTELSAHRSYEELHYDIHFWRTKSGLALGWGDPRVKKETGEVTKQPGDDSLESSMSNALRLSRRAALSLGAGALVMGPAVLRAATQEQVTVTQDWSDDAFFGEAIIDKDEWRSTPVRHRYLHGQFAGTDTRFVVALPEAPTFKGRFMQFLQGGLGGNELTGYGRNSHQLAFEQGAYYVESNQGHIGNDLSGLKGDMTILEWRASAQAARFAKTVAEAMYSAKVNYGYVTGGSGGGMRSINCIENAPDIWNGAVPYMINRAGLMPFNWSLTAWASVMLQGRLKQLAQASLQNTDTFSVLETDAERDALTTLYQSGYPRGAEDQLGPNPLWILGIQTAVASDPRYFLEFWTKAGYEGADGVPEVKALTLDFETEVEAVLSGDEVAAGFASDPDSELTGVMRASLTGKAPAAIRLKNQVPDSNLLGASLQFSTGAAAGQRIMCTGAVNDALTARFDPRGFADVRPGDKLRVSNRNLLAFMFFHRHVVDQRYPGMQQFFDNGKPRYLQRDVNFDRFRVPTARFRGKVILMQHMLDREALPTCAEPYVQDVKRNLGADADASFRIWWTANAQHGVPADERTRYIDFRGVCAQGVADVIAWVEQGTPPPASTSYSFDATNQVVLPARAADRRGLQPTIAFTVNGHSAVTVKAGESIRLLANVDVPPGAGRVASVAFDLDGSGEFAIRQTVPGSNPTSHTAELDHVFNQPGVYVVSVLVEATRGAGGYPVPNLARVVATVT